MKFLVLGHTGMAGHLIATYLKEQGHEVDGYGRRAVIGIKTIIGDAMDTEYLEQVIRKGNYDVVVNCIGILNNDAEEHKSNAVFLNAYLPHFLADITKKIDTWVIHMSTDCVFAGNTGPYDENSVPDGTTFYDRSKALGELKDNKNLTFRNSIVGPDINNNGIGLFNWFMKQENTINGYTKAMWTGMTTLELAKKIEKAAKVHPTGLVNMVPQKNISKYELLQLFNKYFKKGQLEIIPKDSFVLDKTLVRKNYSFNENVSDYEQMIKEMYDWIVKHKDLYGYTLR